MPNKKKTYTLIFVSIAAGFAFISFEYLKNRNYPSKEIYSYQLELQDKYEDLSYGEIEKLPKQDRPDLAALQHFQMTQDPQLGFPPIERKVAAYEKLLKNFKNNSGKTASSNIQWIERGPNNVGGRTRALMFDPNDATDKKVWAGGISGGLWINQDITNQDIGWTNIDDFMTSLSIATLTYDPNTTTTFYLGTGERFTHDFAGLGIWKSIDGGSSWNHLVNTSEFSYVPKMVVTNNSTIIAATENGIKRSTDGGDSWSSPASANVDMADVELASNGDLYAGNFSGMVYKSIDDGVSWTTTNPSTGGQRVEIGLAESNRDVIYAMSDSGGNVAWFTKSVDAGVSWTDVTIPKYRSQDCTESSDDFTRGQAWYDLIIGVHPTDENIVIVGGIDLHRSTDGGSTWGMVSYWTGGCDSYVHADQHAIVFRPNNPNEGIIGNDGGVHYSADVGNAADPVFNDRNKNYNVTQFYDAATVNEVLSNEFLAGAQDNGTQRFLEPGVGSTEEATGGDGGFCHIDQDDPDFQITSYIFSNYFISSSHGESFATLHNDGDDVGRFINPTEYDSDANILYGAAGTDQMTRISNITTSPNSLETLTLDLGGRQITTIKASPFTNNRLYVGVRIASGEGLLFIVDNADQAIPTVTNLSANFNATRGGWVSSFDIGVSDDQLLVTFSNYGVHSIFESSDGGSNWSSKEGDLDDIPVYHGLYNPYDRNQVLIATELGVWSTEDISTASPNWVTTNIGLANVSTRRLKIRESDGLIVAATFGRGLFTTSSFNPNSIASMSISSSTTYSGSDVSFTNSSIGTVDNLLWNFGDGYTTTLNNPTHKFATAGKYTITLEINDGQSVDQKEVIILQTRPIPYLAADGGDFESNINDFYVENKSGTLLERGNSTISGKDGTTSGDNAWVTGMMEDQYADDSRAYLYSPGLDFSANGAYTLSFKVKHSFEQNWDGFIIEYTTDEGLSWIKLGSSVESGWYNQLTETNAIWGDGVPIFSDTTLGFETKTKDVSFLQASSKVGFRVNFGTDANTVDVGMAIDDFEVNGPSSNPVPNFLSSNPDICAGGVVEFNDNSTGTILSYAWNFGSGATPSSVTGSGPHEVTYAVEGQYSATLTVTGSSGDVVETKLNYVNVIASSSISNGIQPNLSEFTVCDTFDGLLTVLSSNVDVRYQAFNSDSDISMGQYKIGNGNDIVLNIGELTETVTTYVKATTTSGCEIDLESSTFTSVGPHDKTVTNDYSTAICSGDVVTFTIENSDVGVTYRIENITDNSEMSSVVGDGNSISLETGVIIDALSVILKGTASINSCTIVIADQLDIEVNSLPDATITQTGSIMEVLAGEKNYQWYFEGEMIDGATRFSYNPTKLGGYTCEVTSNFDCVVMSEVFITVVTGYNDRYLGSSIFVYPNPASDKVYLDISNDYKGQVKISIYNIDGKLFYSGLESKYEQEMQKGLNISGYNMGFYFVELQFGDRREIRKFVIK